MAHRFPQLSLISVFVTQFYLICITAYILFTYKAQQPAENLGAPPIAYKEIDQGYRSRALSQLRPNRNSYVALCLVVKDEHKLVREWILYHHLLGVQKFYIFDEGSNPPMAGVLLDFIQLGLVEYNFLFAKEALEKDGATFQDAKYNTCLHRYGSRHRFMGFIDTDEFVVLQQGDTSLPAMLRDYEQYGGLVLMYRSFASSGHVMRPREGVLASYTRCHPRLDVAGYVKSFVRTDACGEMYHAHNCIYKQGLHSVNVWGEKYTGESTPVQWPRPERAVLHHYFTRSLQDWMDKMERGGPMHKVDRQPTDFRWVDAGAVEECRQGLVLAQRLKERFGDLLLPPPEADA